MNSPLSGKFLQQKSCYPESLCFFFTLWTGTRRVRRGLLQLGACIIMAPRLSSSLMISHGYKYQNFSTLPSLMARRRRPLTVFHCGGKSSTTGTKEMEERSACGSWLAARAISRRSGRSQHHHNHNHHHHHFQVSEVQGQKAAEEMESRWRETSALSGSNVDLLFLELTKEMLVKRKPEGPTCNETSPDKLGGGREVGAQSRLEPGFRLPRGASLRNKAQRIRKKPDCCS